MHVLTGDSRYVDVLERTLYNALLAGINLRGDRIFYVNPLSSRGDHHRQAWYGCACCPSNITRFLPSLGNYIYSTAGNDVWVNLYIGNETTLPSTANYPASITIETGYPFSPDIHLTLHGKAWRNKTLRLRIPAWSNEYSIRINGKLCKKINTEQGYAVLNAKWNDGDRVTLSLDLSVRLTAAAPQVAADAGMRAVERGPLVYCAEAADNTFALDNVLITSHTPISVGPSLPSLDYLPTLQVDTSTSVLTLIPYFAWDNRAAGATRVWLPYVD